MSTWEHVLPDLAQHQCVSFTMKGVLPIDSALVNRVAGQRVTPSKPFAAMTAYLASRRVHYAAVAIGREPRQPSELVITAACDLQETAESLEANTPAMGALQRLSDVGVEMDLTYELDFILGRRAVKKLFPLKPPPGAGGVIDEVRGFTGVKRLGDQLAYIISVDSPDLDDVHVNLEMKRRGVFGAGLTAQAVEAAADILAGVVPRSEWGD